MERNTGGMARTENREPIMIGRSMYCPVAVITSTTETERISGQGTEEVGIMILKPG